MANTYSAGIVTAYGAAVRGGYTGTYEEFCAQQAAFAENAEQVAEDRAAVEQIKTTFENQTVPAAVQQLTQAGAAQVQAVQAAGDAEENDIAAAGAAEEAAVQAAGAAQVTAVQAAGAAQVTAVQGAGTTQAAAVNAAGAAQVDAVEDKGEEVLASIPQDYSALSGEVDGLKSAITSEGGINSFAVDAFIPTWNLWDGTWGLSNKHPATGVNYSFMVFSPKIPVVAGNWYSVGVLNNPLYGTKVNVVGINWRDSTDTAIGSPIVLWPQGGRISSKQAPSGAAYAYLYFNSNNGSVSVSPEDIYAADIKAFFANRLVNISARDTSGQYYVKNNEWVASYILEKEAIESPISHIVQISPTNVNFNLRNALEEIAEYGFPSENNRYEVRLLPGTHDVRSYYTAEERAASEFKGLFVPDYVTIVGVAGKGKTTVIWDGSADSASTTISTLNIKNVASLMGITVIGNNIRYTVHDDFANSQDIENIRYVEDCEFVGINTAYNCVYGSGSGTYGGAKWHFKNCIFRGSNLIPFMQHNSPDVGTPSFLTFENCRFYGAKNFELQLASYNSGVTVLNYATIIGCKFAEGSTLGKIYMNEAGGQGIKYKVSGFGNVLDSVNIVNTDGVDYSGYVDLI